MPATSGPVVMMPVRRHFHITVSHSSGPALQNLQGRLFSKVGKVTEKCHLRTCEKVYFMSGHYLEVSPGVVSAQHSGNTDRPEKVHLSFEKALLNRSECFFSFLTGLLHPL